ncbi:hypothetical protein QJ854_gp603 [Moumouvirus goulette]|uniref:Uncharacterized protein n=1 Tax=Moumouvirus goulette TaxID=1247379 RepID=M1PB97_9VIRU|nr:hypothetical protein QJ854_gp603 [Moumouvirus goulette]AGF85179.1 hypothetical protein glt_00370 [Moumouvirus goulette]
MIKLNTPVIKEEIRPVENRKSLNRLHPISTIHDISTRNLFDIFSDPDSQFILVKLITLVEPWIYLHTNVKLIDNGHLPLIDNESINLISRGKYIFDYYFSQEKNKYGNKTSLLNNILEYINGNQSDDFFKKYTKYLDMPNMSFDLNIKTNNVNRFEIIEKYVVESMVEIFDLLTDGFDTLMDHADNISTLKTFFRPLKSAYGSVENININYNIPDLTKLKKIMAKPYFNYSIDLMLNPSSENIKNIRQNNYSTVDEITKHLDNLLNKTDDIMFFPYIYYFSKTICKNQASVAPGIIKYEVAIQNEIKKYFILLSEKNIYSKKNIKRMFGSIINDLSEMNQNTFYLRNMNIYESSCSYNDVSLYETIVIPKKLGIRDIEIIPRESIYLYNGSNKTESKIIETQNKKHSIIFDQSLAKITRSNTWLTDFDIFKVDLNIAIFHVYYNNQNVIYPIVADFVSINIERINSSSYVETVNTEPVIINYLENPNINIKSYDKKTLIHKLTKNIFDGEHYLPWYITNYNKSLARVLFLLNTERQQYITFLKKLLTTDDKKKLINYSMFYCFNYQAYSFYNLIWTEPKIHRQYYEIEYIIKFIIIMDELVKLPDLELNKIFSDFNVSYGWCQEDVDVPEIKESYARFKKELLDIVNTLDEMHKE